MRSTLKRLGGLALMLMLAGGCSDVIANGVHGAYTSAKKIASDNSLQSHSVKAIKTVEIHRIAVMPIIEAPDVLNKADEKEIADGAGESITAELYSQASLAGGWEVVPMDDVRLALEKLPPTTPLNIDQNAIALGKALGADAVMYGQVERYQERVGYDYSAAQPASVAFALKFVDIANGAILWNGKFVKSQKALTQNIFNVVNFVDNQGRWVRAHEIAQQGVKESVADLHDQLNLEQNVKRFETGTYGELKSGVQRYNENGGLYE